MKNKKITKPNRQQGIIHPNAAGIDLGSREHWVALPPGRSQQTVQSFECYTEDLEKMARWLKHNGIETIAMESTGVYWVPVYQVLERHGFDVQLVSTKHMKTVPGRKTDIIDCQWIQYLHERGLLQGSFRPADAICVIRSYVRQRENLIDESSRHILRMQKALEQMNIQLHKVVRDITGQTGQKIIEAILEGERDPNKLAAYRNYRCHKSIEEIAKGMVGDWREEHLFCLRQEYEAYKFIRRQISACEQAALQVLKQLEQKTDISNLPPSKSKEADNELRQVLFLATGVDLTKISGLAPTSIQSIIAETGVDITRWHSEKAFANWCNLAPKNKITGGKRYRVAKESAVNRVAGIFRIAARTLANSHTALGAFYRRMRGRKGSTFANSVTAHKLCKIFYRMLKYGDSFVELGANYYDGKYKEIVAKSAIKRLRKLGYSVQLSLPIITDTSTVTVGAVS
jgi:transposase